MLKLSETKNLFNPLILLGVALLAPPTLLWGAVFSAAGKTKFLGGMATPLLDHVPKFGEILTLVACPLAAAILGFIAYRQLRAENEKFANFALLTIGTGGFFILVAVMVLLRNS